MVCDTTDHDCNRGVMDYSFSSAKNDICTEASYAYTPSDGTRAIDAGNRLLMSWAGETSSVERGVMTGLRFVSIEIA